MPKPKLLIVELWGLGDLVIATPFLRAATEKFDVTVLAKPFALDLQPRFWPEIKVVAFNAPWTAFKKKYHLWRWPILEMIRLRRKLAAEQFDFGLSARRVASFPLSGDLRDHLLLKLFGVKNRIGFPFLGSRILLTQPLIRPEPQSHRYESWRAAGNALGIELPPREKISIAATPKHETILIHSGAGQAVRVWPLERYKNLASRLRQKHFQVQVACDPDQRDGWLRDGEIEIATPKTVAELISLIDRAGAFIGNDSGPGHLAAFCGVPTFTIFGPQLPEWFAPLHPQAEWIEGKACPYKPCSDYCRFSKPFCIQDLSEEEVWPRVEQFLKNVKPLNR
ncbi:MAG: glycosyltransferase family 9 protein [Limisphaerales bacterium]